MSRLKYLEKLDDSLGLEIKLKFWQNLLGRNRYEIAKKI